MQKTFTWLSPFIVTIQGCERLLRGNLLLQKLKAIHILTVK